MSVTDMDTITTQSPPRWRTVLDRLRNWSLANSPWLVHYNSGSCNG